MGIHCAIVPHSLVLHSETMRQLITIWPLSTFTKFPILSVVEERRTMVCVKREHGSEMGCRVVFSSLLSYGSLCDTLTVQVDFPHCHKTVLLSDAFISNLNKQLAYRDITYQ